VIGDVLYGLTPKELVSAPVIQRFAQRGSNLLAAVSVSGAIAQVPGDMILRLTDFSIIADGGAAQTVTGLAVSVMADDTFVTVVHTLLEELDLAALSVTRRFQCDVMMMPDEVILAIANYSAAVAANGLRLSALGYMLPRGNTQFRS